MGVPFQTADGLIDLTALSPRDVSAWRVADALAKINRFSGRTPEPWSVAAHSVLVARLVDAPEQKAWALLHDAHEAILGDMTSPAVAFIAEHGLPYAGATVRECIDRAKARVDRVIGAAWAVATRPRAAEIVQADRIALQAEMAIFFGASPVLEHPDDAERIERALAIIDELPVGQNWRVAREVWLVHARSFAREGLLRLPAEDDRACMPQPA
ncbi:hypothetical protein [Rhodovulum strictum]|uniref:hypothetical protein n=1 Tax=Rhodovulum strictum TaxID=58314 RepID=UPI00147853AF|nr:hypothetical protein [Rhodovulum strictum]